MPEHEDDDVTYTRILGSLGGEQPAVDGSLPHDGPTLIWRPKNGPDQMFPLELRITKIGRHQENDVMLAGPTVSSRHATVRREPIGVVIEDEGSLNGTFVNGVRIEQQLLEDGDRIQVGPHLLLFAAPSPSS